MAVFLNAFQDLTESPLSQIYVTEEARLPHESRRLACRATSPACSSAVRSEYGWGCFEVCSPGVGCYNLHRVQHALPLAMHGCEYRILS